MSKPLIFESQEPLELESGKTLSQFELAYETYGKLNARGTNAILVCHAVSGHSTVAGPNGWWKDFVGPGKAIDTKKHFVICSNTLGGCSGSTGPGSVNPETKKVYGLSFPVVTIGDMVHAQKRLLDSLGIKRLKMVIGASMGGMQALEWAINYPDVVKACVPIATTAKLSPQALAFGAVGRHAITSDPNWNNGDYYKKKNKPEKGLSTARMIGHITYLSEHSFSSKFGRKLQEKADYGYDFNTDFQIESYLQHQGDKFVVRFDANSYLYLSKAMSYFDLDKKYKSLEKALGKTLCSFLIISITSDLLYPSEQSKELAKTLMKLNRPVTFVDVDSPYGHDSFLIEHEKFASVVKPFLKGIR